MRRCSLLVVVAFGVLLVFSRSGAEQPHRPPTTPLPLFSATTAAPTTADSTQQRNASSSSTAGAIAPPSSSSFAALAREQAVVHPRTGERLLVVFAGNNGFRNMIANLVCMLRRVGVRSFVFVALDADVHRWALANGVSSVELRPVAAVSSSSRPVEASAQTFGSAKYRRLVQLKNDVLLAAFDAVEWRASVVFIDLDIALFRSPLELSPAAMPRGDVHLFVQANALGRGRAACTQSLNSGFFLARPTEYMRAALTRVLALCASDESLRPGHQGNQWAFHRVFVEQDALNATRFIDCEIAPTGAFSLACTRRKTGAANLPARDLDACARSTPLMAVHYNYISGIAEKTERMRSAGQWLVLTDSAGDDQHFRCRQPRMRRRAD